MAWIDNHLDLDPALLARIAQTEEEIAWVREASAQDLFDVAMTTLGLRTIECPFGAMTAMELGDMPHSSLVAALEPHFEQGTTTVSDVADQIQLCRAFSDPAEATDAVSRMVEDTVAKFPVSAKDLEVGDNRGDVLDPFHLAASYWLISQQNMKKTIEYLVAHKVLMKIEGLVGHLHQNTIGLMRGNFRVGDPKGTRTSRKGMPHPRLNPFPGADIGQVALPEGPDAPWLAQIKSKTGSANSSSGALLGQQLLGIGETYDVVTVFAALVGNTLEGHRSMSAVLRESPRTVVLVGEAALGQLTQSAVGGELLLRIYERAFRQASLSGRYCFAEVVASIVEEFEHEAKAHNDFLDTVLHNAIGGQRVNQDSRTFKRQGTPACSAPRS